MSDTITDSQNTPNDSGVPPKNPETVPSESSQNNQRPSTTFLQADIDRSVDYRKEYYKYVLGISTALLAFTMSFQPTLRVIPEYIFLEVIGWMGLGFSIAAGVYVHMVWSKFYATYQKYDNKGLSEAGKIARGEYNCNRRLLDTILIISLFVGGAGVISFTAFNLKNVALKTDEKVVEQKADSHIPAGTTAPNGLAPSSPQHINTPDDSRS